jgi:hypothetical protein
MTTVALIKKPGRVDSGVGRYTAELEQSLISEGLNLVEVYPTVPIPNWIIKMISHLFGWDLYSFFITYPIWITYPRADLYHLASQNLATLMVFHKPPGKTLLTVHDLINLEFKPDHRPGISRRIAQYLFEQLVLIGIRKVDWLILDSHFSKVVLQNYSSPDSKIRVRKPHIL